MDAYFLCFAFIMFAFTVNTFPTRLHNYESVVINDADIKLQTTFFNACVTFFFFLLWSTLKPRIGYHSRQKAHLIAGAHVKDSMTDLSKWGRHRTHMPYN